MKINKKVLQYHAIIFFELELNSFNLASQPNILVVKKKNLCLNLVILKEILFYSMIDIFKSIFLR